jgi:DNA-binding transcriptional regulator GbsR (MarR family)
MMELWGFKRIHGMVWTYIYLQPKPVSAADIREGLGISTGLASMTLADLQHWDVVHRRSPPGERRDFFEAEANIWRPILKVLREREYYQINTALEVLRDVRASLDVKGNPGLEYASKQLDLLIQAGDLGRKLMGQFLDVGQYLLQKLPRTAWSKQADQVISTMASTLSKLMVRD